MLTGEQRERWLEEVGFRQLTQILFWRWDPIGVAEDLPYSEGEYDEYARRLVPMLLDGASRAEIAAFLVRVEREWMEQRADAAAVDEVAGFIESWFRKSVERWLELGA